MFEATASQSTAATWRPTARTSCDELEHSEADSIDRRRCPNRNRSGVPVRPIGDQVTFSYRRTDYRIDLRPTNADKIEAAFAPYIKSAEKSPRQARRVRQPRPYARHQGLVGQRSNYTRSGNGLARTASTFLHVGASKPRHRCIRRRTLRLVSSIFH
ncbi:Lsr2 dimerization domain-containing protein [Rhodococcus erythropolis]|uniref:Lsr2 dimerization domain-containing protein n=1 Tax=Rhodococcus erythropolis TaxID=1833 RepID=UPI003F65ECBA